MNIQVDFQTRIPIYIQVMDQIKQLIAAKEINPGDQLPTVRQLAADLRVNFNTIARVYRLLDEDGIISTQHGRGTFILDPLPAKDAKKLRRQDLTRLTRHYLQAAHRLGITPQEVEKSFESNLELWIKQGDPASLEQETKNF